jgi:competence protein ComEC
MHHHRMEPFNWCAHPALRAVLALAAGIALGGCGSVPMRTALGVMAVAAVSTALAIARPWRLRGAVSLCLVAASGGLLGSVADSESSVVPSVIAIRGVEAVGTIAEPARVRAGRVEIVLACDSLILRSTTAHPRASLLLTVDTAAWSDAPRLGRGDRVSCIGLLRAPRRPIMPAAFDERRYLAARGVGMTLGIDDVAQLHVITRARGISPGDVIAWVRNRMAEFASTHVGGEEGAIVEALLSGERGGIDADTRAAFAATGTMHVLAVSGLHVAVIALALSVVTSWIPDRRAQFFIFALVLGAYTLVAGAGPSIVRAWCMATCIVLARLLGRRTRPLNILATSAVVILVTRPLDLYDIGFQLSFGAVAGIVLFNARWNTALDERWPALRDRAVTNWTVRALVLTLAAQALTAPLLLVHFGAIPALGMLLNIPVVPLTSCAMAAAAIGVVTAALPGMPEAMGATAFVATKLAMLLVETGAALPYASVVTAPLDAIVAALAIAAAIGASRARTIGPMSLRLCLVAVALAGAMRLERHGLGAPSRRATRAYIVPAARGVVVALPRGDTLVVVTGADTTGTARRLAPLEQRLATSVRRFVTTTGDAPARPSGVPVVLDRSTSRPRLAQIEGVPVLVVGMRQRLDRVLLFELERTWNERPWH